MHTFEREMTRRTDLESPVRNKFFYGKLMDAYHFELETNYFNSKRWLLNRLVSGYGVICGLDVIAIDDGAKIRVTPGVAIDKWGREIIVPAELTVDLGACLSARTGPSSGQKQQQNQEANCVHIVICYHECDSDPAPVLAGECPSPEPCAPGAIREKYRIACRDGAARAIGPLLTEPDIPDVITGQGIDYQELAKHISQQGCPAVSEDPCIVLANIHLNEKQTGHCAPDGVDISVRPIVLSNDLLFQLILSLLHQPTTTVAGFKK